MHPLRVLFQLVSLNMSFHPLEGHIQNSVNTGFRRNRVITDLASLCFHTFNKMDNPQNFFLYPMAGFIPNKGTDFSEKLLIKLIGIYLSRLPKSSVQKTKQHRLNKFHRVRFMHNLLLIQILPQKRRPFNGTI